MLNLIKSAFFFTMIFCVLPSLSFTSASADPGTTIAQADSIEAGPSAQTQLNGKVNASAFNSRSEATHDQCSMGNQAPLVFKDKHQYQCFIEEWMQQNHSAYENARASLDPSEVVLIDRGPDRFQATLKAFGIQHIDIAVDRMLSFRHGYYYKPIPKKWNEIPWTKAKAIVIECYGMGGCCGWIDRARANNFCSQQIADEAKEKLRTFVQNGGLLITTGYTSGDIANIFPGVLNLEKQYRFDLHLRDFFPLTYKPPMWDIKAVHNSPQLFAGVPEQLRYTNSRLNPFYGLPLIISPVDPDKTQILAVSSRLAQQDPTHQGIVAAMFQYGRGHILLYTCHFKNESDSRTSTWINALTSHPNINLPEMTAVNAIIAQVLSKKNQQVDNSIFLPK
jgi:hypothetical protein